MAIVKFPPNTVHLGGPSVIVNDVAAGASILPGMLVERYNSSGTPLWRLQSVAAVAAEKAVALNTSMINKGVQDAYAVGDLMEVAIGGPGTSFWMRIAIGQNIVTGAKLESAGDGTLRVLAAGVPLFVALEAKDATSVAQMIRVETL